MKRKKKNAIQFIRLLLIYSAVVSLLAMNNRVFASFQTNELSKNKTENALTKEKAEKESSQKNISIQELSVEAVVPLAKLPLQQALFVLFSLDFPLIQEIELDNRSPQPLLPALANTFEHHIAIHAP